MLRGPKFAATDLSLMKNVPLGGTMQFQIRAEIFNAFNTVNYGNPGGTFGAATFGRISPAASPCGRCSWAESSCSDAQSSQELCMKTSNRRSFIRRGVTAAAAVTAAAIPTTAAAQTEKPVKKVHYRNGRKPEKTAAVQRDGVATATCCSSPASAITPKATSRCTPRRCSIRSSSSSRASDRRWTKS